MTLGNMLREAFASLATSVGSALIALGEACSGPPETTMTALPAPTPEVEP